MKKTVAIMMVVISACGMSQTLTTLNNIPRIGDALDRIEVMSQTIRTDSAGMVVDLSNCKEMNNWKICYLQPASDDSISDMVVTTEGRSVCQLVETSYGLAVISEAKPGQRITYDLPLPEFVLTDTLAAYSGKGRKGSLVKMQSEGLWRTYKNYVGSVITPECDTLSNVACSECTVSGDLIIESNDSIVDYQHNGRRKQWYVLGYRYPILEMMEHTFYDGSSVVDYSCQWSYYPLALQEKQVQNDPENEELRQEYIMQKNRNSQPLTRADGKSVLGNGQDEGSDFLEKENSDNGLAGSGILTAEFNWKESEQIAEVIVNHQNGERVDVVLYDSAGRQLGFKQTGNDVYDLVKFSMQEYISGMFLITVKSGNDKITFKFLKL